MNSAGSHIIVIGAGVFGSWTAEHLRRTGNRVTLVDAWGPAHDRASSGGESRMTRAAYGEDAIYSRMAWDSLREWQALGQTAGVPVFVRHGVLFFTAFPDDYFHGTLEVHRQMGLPTKALSRAQMRSRFPMIDFSDIELGIWEPEFGALMARRAVQMLVQRFVARGGEYRQDAVRLVPIEGPLRSVRLARGEELAGDAFVVAAGPWLPKMFPDLLGKRMAVTRQETFYFSPPKNAGLFGPSAMPGWADFNGGDFFYGFPNLEGRGVKFAHDRHGPAVDPDTQSRDASDEALKNVIAFRDRRFPLLRDARLTSAEVCQYENSSSGDFLIDFHPDMPNVLLVGCGSGHGFKHGPEVGRRAAGRILRTTDLEPRFGLATKDAGRDRKVH